MEKTKFEEMFDRLPSNIKETEILRLSSKKVLAALLELLLHSEAKLTGIVFVNNQKLRKIAGVGMNDFLPSINQLIDYGLIERKKGIEKGKASEYIVNLKKLKEPLKMKTFDELFEDVLKDTKSLEKPISTPITIPITITTPTTITNTITNTITTPITTSTTTSNTENDIIDNFNKTIELETNIINNLDNRDNLKEGFKQWMKLVNNQNATTP